MKNKFLLVFALITISFLPQYASAEDILEEALSEVVAIDDNEVINVVFTRKYSVSCGGKLIGTFEVDIGMTGTAQSSIPRSMYTAIANCKEKLSFERVE